MSGLIRSRNIRPFEIHKWTFSPPVPLPRSGRSFIAAPNGSKAPKLGRSAAKQRSRKLSFVQQPQIGLRLRTGRSLIAKATFAPFFVAAKGASGSYFHRLAALGSPTIASF